MKKKYILLYGCDYAPRTKILCGPETIHRMEVLLEYIHCHPEERISVLLMAGKRKLADYPLKLAMKKRLDGRCLEEATDSASFNIPEIIVAEENRWSTLEETIGALQILEKDGANEIIVISSDYHLPRIKLIWRMISDIQVTAIPVHADVHRLSPLLEPIKFLVFFYRYARILRNDALCFPI